MKKYYFVIAGLILAFSSVIGSAATVNFWAYGSDDSTNHGKYLNTDLNGHRGKAISIDYTLGKRWTDISAHLWLKAVDDTCVGRILCKDGLKSGWDPSEKAIISKIEGIPGRFGVTEINKNGWYDLNLDVTAFLLADTDNIFNAMLRPSMHRDFVFKNAKLVIDYNLKPVPVPAAAWLFSSALLGLFRVKRKP